MSKKTDGTNQASGKVNITKLDKLVAQKTEKGSGRKKPRFEQLEEVETQIRLMRENSFSLETIVDLLGQANLKTSVYSVHSFCEAKGIKKPLKSSSTENEQKSKKESKK